MRSRGSKFSKMLGAPHPIPYQGRHPWTPLEAVPPDPIAVKKSSASAASVAVCTYSQAVFSQKFANRQFLALSKPAHKANGGASTQWQILCQRAHKTIIQKAGHPFGSRPIRIPLLLRNL